MGIVLFTATLVTPGCAATLLTTSVIERGQALVVVVLRLGHRDPRGGEALRVEPGGRRGDLCERLHCEPAPDEERERERHLRHDQSTANGALRPAHPARAALSFSTVWGGRRATPIAGRSPNATPHTRQVSALNASGRAVDAHVDHARPAALDDPRREEVDEPSRREDRSAERADEEHDDRLGHHLRGDAPGRRAERRPRRHLRATRLCPGEEEVRHVGADDHEHERHRREEHPDARPRRPHELLVKVDEAYASSVFESGWRASRLFCDRLTSAPAPAPATRPSFRRPIVMNSWSPRSVAICLRVVVVAHRERRPHVARVAVGRGEAEARRRDADDRVGLRVQGDRSPEDAGIGREAPVPQRRAQHGDARRSEAIVLGRQQSPARGADAEHREEVARDVGARRALSGLAPGERQVERR